VGGLNWVSTRLYPLVRSICPDHPLLRETRVRYSKIFSTCRLQPHGFKPNHKFDFLDYLSCHRLLSLGSSLVDPKFSDMSLQLMPFADCTPASLWGPKN